MKSLFLLVGVALMSVSAHSESKIDRKALVTRHNIIQTKLDKKSPMQVGNGEFAFNMDITGLQTFVPFNTMSHWGWHSSALPAGAKAEDYKGRMVDTHGRPVWYPLEDPEHPAISAWLAGNPHAINLGRVGLILLKANGQEATEEDIANTVQKLDLWTGIVKSSFTLEGQKVEVTTACYPSVDTIGVRIKSNLIKLGRLKVFVACPGNNPLQFADYVGDWEHPGTFEVVQSDSANRMELVRRLDDTVYNVSLGWTGKGKAQVVNKRVVLAPSKTTDTFSFDCGFNPADIAVKQFDADEILKACKTEWPAYWKQGGAIDLSQSKDPRWKELERRIVLSQYLMKVNEAGSWPPQESGLVNNGWFGRFHLEMVWWHCAHWALWNRWHELDRNLEFYERLLPGAEARAQKQGYLGAKWPKCPGPTQEEWPHPIHSFLQWQQTHPIFFAELDYRAHPNKKTLEKWADIVESTADYCASFAFYDTVTKRYVLGPPIHLVSENTDPYVTKNPTFELSYWRFALRVAQTWHGRLGLKPKAEWDKVLKGLAPLPQENGLYVLYEGVADMWTKYNFEHPAISGIYGMLPGDGVDKAVLKRTMDQMAKTWQFNRVWGWDFPMLAMCAAKLGDPELAIDYLMTKSEGFQFDEHGLATGGPFPYFPSNGGLLYAVALMAKGWDGAPKRHAPGFPSNGKWVVRYENLSVAP